MNHHKLSMLSLIKVEAEVHQDKIVFCGECCRVVTSDTVLCVSCRTSWKVCEV